MECRNVDVTSWESLVNLVDSTGSTSKDIAEKFADSFEKLLLVHRDVSEEFLSNHPQKPYLEPFFEVYEKASENGVDQFRKELESADPERIDNLAKAL